MPGTALAQFGSHPSSLLQWVAAGSSVRRRVPRFRVLSGRGGSRLVAKETGFESWRELVLAPDHTCSWDERASRLRVAFLGVRRWCDAGVGRDEPRGKRRSCKTGSIKILAQGSLLLPGTGTSQVLIVLTFLLWKGIFSVSLRSLDLIMGAIGLHLLDLALTLTWPHWLFFLQISGIAVFAGLCLFWQVEDLVYCSF